MIWGERWLFVLRWKVIVCFEVRGDCLLWGERLLFVLRWGVIVRFEVKGYCLFWREVIVHYVGIGGIVNHHCLTFLFKIQNTICSRSDIADKYSLVILLTLPELQRPHGQYILEYEFRSRTPKLSNHNAIFIGYDDLMECIWVLEQNSYSDHTYFV